MDYVEVDEYLQKLSEADGYTTLEDTERKKKVFSAQELLLDNFSEDKLTARAVALQTLYMIEGEDEGIARLRRQGAESYSNKGVSITLSGSGISPDVMDILKPGNRKKSYGWLV